ncbi:MAG: AMP-binding protein [Acidimicrobiaceae bacterium]|nr:AMP-binding protein [Acidimicrobiaceae bacterium]
MTVSQATELLTAKGQPFEVAREDIRGVPTLVWAKAPKNLVELLHGSSRHGDKTFLVFEDERYSFTEHYELVLTLAAELLEMGVEKGDRVAIAMRNYPEWIISFWATISIGAIAVPLNAWWSGDELAYGLENSGSKVLIFDQERIQRVAPYLSELSQSADLSVLAVRCSQDVSSKVPASIVQREMQDILKSGVRKPIEALIEADDPAVIFYTSGTTGRAKGAIGTHRNLVTNLMNAFFVTTRSTMLAKERSNSDNEATEAPAESSYLLSVPLFHATGCFATMIPNLVAGNKIVLMRRWDPEDALALIERERVTFFGGVPTMVWQVLNSPNFAKYDTSSIRNISYGGAPAPSELVRRIKEHFPTGMPSNGYGLTETSAIAAMNVGDDYVRKPDSVGPPVPVCEVRIIGSDGTDQDINTPGELWIKGANVIPGYWNNQEATAASFSNGWLHSGDVAFIDEEGYLHIVDRAKDMLIRGGENVYSPEVEGAIYEHPAVADVAVVGIPDLVLGEEVCAIIQLRPGHSLSEQELKEHVAKRLAHFKVPKYVYFREDALPRNAAGKLLKRQLKNEMTENK